jgi:hypothetical protein
MTQCINPAEIREGDLSAYADGEAEPRVATHVRRCTFCQATVAVYRRMQPVLAVVLDRAACPAAETLGDFYLNALPAGQKLVVAKHLRECRQCAAELKEFDRPARRGEWLAGLKGLPGVLKGVLAATLVPLRPQAVPRGDVTRPHYYRAGDLNISIGYRPITDRRGVLSGVIISPLQSSLTPVTALCPPVPPRLGGEGGGERGEGRSLAGIHVTLFRQGEEISLQPADELGRFVFEDVPPGEYDLAFDWDERVVLVTGIKAS